MTASPLDVVVLGAGPGGFDAAVDAARHGLSAALVEKDDLGGTCLNRGCIPTKLLLGATAAVDELAAQVRMKTLSGEIRADLSAIRSRTERLVAGSRKAMAQRLADLGVRLVRGVGRLAGKGRVLVETADGPVELSARNVVVATGATPASFPGMAPDGQAVLDSTGFLSLTGPPASLIVVGAGFIGLEMAQAAHRLGASVTLVDALDRVAAAEDPEVSEVLASLYKRWKWTIRLGVKVGSAATREGRAVLTLESGEEFAADKCLIAVGRRPVSAGLGLQEAGCALAGPGFVKTDAYLQAADGIYAVGDVNGRIQLAHAASHQAAYVARRLAGKESGPYESGPVPSILYGSPETMRVGRMADELKKDGLPCRVSRFALAANPIAQAHAATHGFVKAVWSEGRLVGVTAVGHDVSRLITAASLLVGRGATAEECRRIMFAHPTLDEALLGALSAEQQDV